MAHVFPDIAISLPAWLQHYSFDTAYPAVENRMQLVIELSRLNVELETGGPFAAAVFDVRNHRLLAPGVNRVVPAHASVAHAEIIALTIAQQMQHHFDLGATPESSYELVSSTEPCAMCFGALPWSGISSLVCGARDADARRIGFDEGPKHQDWQHQLRARGIQVQTDVCRKDAVAVLECYGDKNMPVYNGRAGKRQLTHHSRSLSDFGSRHEK